LEEGEDPRNLRGKRRSLSLRFLGGKGISEERVREEVQYQGIPGKEKRRGKEPREKREKP